MTHDIFDAHAVQSAVADQVRRPRIHRLRSLKPGSMLYRHLMTRERQTRTAIHTGGSRGQRVGDLGRRSLNGHWLGNLRGEDGEAREPDRIGKVLITKTSARPSPNQKVSSGKRGSNSRPQPWQRCAPPTEP